MPDFGARLTAVLRTRGQLCLGIDPHAFLLNQWGLPDSADGARELGLRAVDAAAGVIGIVKPQVAFFERHGSAGYRALELVLAAARAAGLLVIADVKRGDIGSSIAAYGQAWLTPGSPLEVDAMTAVAYQGVGSLAEPIELARLHDKGIFVLAATSNPEAAALQTAVLAHGKFAGLTVAASVVEEVRAINRTAMLGCTGIVIGATVALTNYGIDARALANTPILAPGFGEQGARLGDLPDLFGGVSTHVVANVGRSVLRAGHAELVTALRQHARELAETAHS